jgi:hypothetical protein
LVVFAVPVYPFVNPRYGQHEQESSEHGKKQTAGILESEYGSDILFRLARLLHFIQVVVEKGVLELP